MEEFFYIDPRTGEYVYRWADERLVLVDSDYLRALEARLLSTGLKVQELLTINERLAEGSAS